MNTITSPQSLPKPLFVAYRQMLEGLGLNRETSLATDIGGTLNPARPWLLSVSGGKDSMLLWYLMELASQAGDAPLGDCPNIEILHICYPFRKAAKAELHSLGDLALDLGRPFHGVDLSQEPIPDSNCEAWARKQRLEAYERLNRRHQEMGFRILLGRHQDDQLETFFLKMFRQATPWTWARQEPLGPNMLCPLITLTRLQILEAVSCIPECNPLGGRWHKPWKTFEDHTNTSMAFRRNIVRQVLLPTLRHPMGVSATGLSRMIDLQENAYETVMRTLGQQISRVLGDDWIQKPSLPYRQMMEQGGDGWPLAVWTWVSEKLDRHTLNAKRFGQLMDTLTRKETQYPKVFSFSERTDMMVSKQMIHAVHKPPSQELPSEERWNETVG
jgi:tRNA(Ile)-lysidine synthase TilS/MesJ